MTSHDSIRVVIVGNSNSIMTFSYTKVLAQCPRMSLQNFSVGGVTNIVLMHVLADPEADLSSADYVIVELAVIESLFLRVGGLYTPTESRENIDLFMESLRRVSNAQVIFLILPTISGLLEPDRQYTEQHYIACAQRHGAAILNAFEIFRDLCELDRKGVGKKFLDLAGRLGRAAGLRNAELFTLQMTLRQTEAERHGLSIGTKGFGWHAFVDTLHISRVFQGLIGDMLCRWMCEQVVPPRTISPVDIETPAVRCPVVDVDKVVLVSRRNSLISRDLIALKAGQSIVLRCPVDYRAVSILVNENHTSAFLDFSSPIGSVSVDVSFGQGGPPWVAKTARIDSDVGGGDIELTISTEPRYGPGPIRPQFLDVGHKPIRGVAEIGEVILVRRDWKSPVPGPDYIPSVMIDKLDWAVMMAREVGTISGRAAVGIREHNVVVPTSMLSVAHESSFHTSQARLLILTHNFEGARVYIDEGLRQAPDNPSLVDLDRALSAAVACQFRPVGEAGREIAEGLTSEQELSRVAPVIAAAIRADAGGPIVDLRFAAGSQDNKWLRSGWLEPSRDGVVAGDGESSLVLPKPPGLGDFVLMIDITVVNGHMQTMTIVAEGKALLQRLIIGRTMTYCLLPRPLVMAAAAEFNVLLRFTNGGACLPPAERDDPGAGVVTVHRVGIATAHRPVWDGYSDIAALLSELNNGTPSTAVHDLGLTGPERPGLTLPRDAKPRTVYTCFGTILYADLGAGRIRHGRSDEVPHNLFLVRRGNGAVLVRATENGGYVSVGLRPEGPHAPQDHWIPWTGGGFVRGLTIAPAGSGAHETFGLTGAGLFVCAEFSGELNLSRLQLGPWERFGFEFARV